MTSSRTRPSRWRRGSNASDRGGNEDGAGGELAGIENLDQLVRGYELGKRARKEKRNKAKQAANGDATANGASDDPPKGKTAPDGATGVHAELIEKTAAIARMPLKQA